ncbi:ABC transporter substrate-binding protein [Oerskovia sp. M15]
MSALEPDLIVVTTDTADNVIDQLEDIAPVVTLRGSDGTDPIGYMRQTVETLATATGTEAKGAALLEGFDAKVTEGKAALEEADVAGASFVMADGWVNNGTVSVRMYTPARSSARSVPSWASRTPGPARATRTTASPRPTSRA